VRTAIYSNSERLIRGTKFDLVPLFVDTGNLQMRIGSLIVTSTLVVGLLGCGGSERHVSGKVTFKGQPIPAGTVYIQPDISKGNSGVSGSAIIKDGHYNTASSGGQGAASGAVVITVEGIDPNPPPGASPDVTQTVLFPPWQQKAELTKSSTVVDIDVPAEALDVKPPPSGPPMINP
jgi:hypothetical protein